MWSEGMTGDGETKTVRMRFLKYLVFAMPWHLVFHAAWYRYHASLSQALVRGQRKEPGTHCLCMLLWTFL